MSLTGLFARRYLFSPKSRSVVNLISGLSVVAVAMPVAAMIILLSVFNGFEQMVRTMYSSFDADLTIQLREGTAFEQTELDFAKIEADERVEALTKIIEERILVEANDKQAMVLLRGVDTAYSDVLPISSLISSGEWLIEKGDFDYLVLGQTMAWQLGIRSLADAEVETYALKRQHFSSLLPMMNYRHDKVSVSGVFQVDYETEQTYVLSSLRFAEQLLGREQQLTSVALRLRSGVDADLVKTQMEEMVGERFEVRTREELRQSFYEIMSSEKWGVFFISFLVVVIASFSIVGALSMLIVDKRDNILTLRALGCDNEMLTRIFRRAGMLICLLGGVVGSIVGVGVCLVQEWFGVVKIPAQTFLTDAYPVDLQWMDFVGVVVAFVGVGWLLSHFTVRNMIKKNL